MLYLVGLLPGIFPGVKIGVVEIVDVLYVSLIAAQLPRFCLSKWNQPDQSKRVGSWRHDYLFELVLSQRLC